MKELNSNEQNYIQKLENALKESETKFNIFFNNTLDMYVAVSPKDATIKFCNQTLLRKTGYKEDEIVGSTIFKLYHPDCLPKVEEAFAEFVKTGKVHNKQLIMKTKNGKKIDVMLNVLAVKDENGDIIYSSSSWRDISEELKAQQDKLENEYLLLESQRMAKVGTWKYNIQTKKLSCSKELYSIFEIKDKQILNKYDQFLNYIHPDDTQKVKNAFEDFLKNTKIYSMEYRLLLSNKTTKYVNAYSEPIFNSEGKFLALIGTIQDTTYIKKMQNELENFNKTLELKIEKKTQVLKQAQKQLIFSEKMASLGSLVAGIAHEINTPIGVGLTGITHFDEMTKKLNKKYKKDLMSQEDFEEYLDTSTQLSKLIHLNLERAAKLIKSFKQIAVDQSSEEERNFFVRTYLEEILANLNNVIKQKNITFDIQCHDNLHIKSYPGSFFHIFSNLIMNSIIHGFIHQNNAKIIINVSIKNKRNLFISYKDNGKGIDPNNLEKIFDPFFTTNREQGGSGLGLNIIYNIITNQLKGSINCISEINKGVEFVISFKV